MFGFLVNIGFLLNRGTAVNGSGPPPPVGGSLQLEDGSGLVLLEDGSGTLLLE